MRQRTLPVMLCAAVAALLVLAAPALATSTLSIQVPASATIGKPADIVYSGFADAPGTAELTGTGENMTLRTFYELGGISCEVTDAQERGRSTAKFDGNQYIQSPAPYSLTSSVQFPSEGTYLFCAYLEIGQSGDTAPPAVAAQATVQVTGPPIPCTVPRLVGLTLDSATKKLKTSGCQLGKVTKPKKWKGLKLVVKTQNIAPSVRAANGTKVNLVLAKRKR